jgi:hypothetical protein
MQDNSFSSIINSANSVIILLPQKPYFDQVAGGLALYLALKDKKETSISASTPMIVEFNRLVGVDKVTQELGNKNLTIKFTDYQANDIERVSYDIENGEFKLTVIPKPGVASPKKEQLVVNYSGVSADTVILVGGGNESHFPQLSSKDLLGAKLVHIGIRSLPISSGKEVLSFARPASSLSELVATLIRENGLALDADIATNLLLGIEEGTRQFSSSETTAETFETVASLIRAGGQRAGKSSVSKSPLPGVMPVNPLEPEKKEPEAPKDWLEPKVYKGTSIS